MSCRRLPNIPLILIACLLTVGPVRGDDHLLTPIDVMKLRPVLAVYASPDGSQIAFVRRTPRLSDRDPGPHFSHLYTVPTSGGEPRLLIGGDKSVRGVQWSPDSTYLAILRQDDDDDHSEVYGLPMNGGEPVRLMQTERGVVRYAWRPDGGAIAFTQPDAAPEVTEQAQAMGFGVVIVDEVWRNHSLYVYDLETEETRRLTSGVHITSFVWSPDGSRLAAAVTPKNTVDAGYMLQRLHLVDPSEPSLEKIVDNPGKLGQYTFSPDGQHLAYISAADRNDPHAGMLYTVDLDSRQVTALTDGFEGMVHHIDWFAEDRIRACISRGVYNHLTTMNVATGEWENESSAGPAFLSMDRVAAGEFQGQYVAAASTAEHPAEVYRYDGEGWKRLTHSNPWLDEIQLGRQEVTRITARDGLEIEGLLMYPVDYEEGQRYPMVIVAHGGPESHFNDGWNTSYSRWGQLLCARGMFAWYPNYRASTGRGVAFAKADHGDPMGGEFNDHLDAIVEFDERGLIDPDRVGIGGGSYGGYTAAWAATRHSEHFAASVAFVAVTDLRTKWFTSDIPLEYYLVHFEEQWPHEQKELVMERSPLTYAENCDTPLLILGGTADTRVHPSQSLMLFRAVKFATETPVRYIQYPGEGHGNRMNVYRYDYCVRSLRWFDQYLKPGDHRNDPLPTHELDYSAWKAAGEDGAE